MKHLSLLIFLFIIAAACKTKPYSETNKSYRKQTRELAKTIQQEPPADSLQPPQDWVGTTNFNLRKPNIVVIHHTAQTSCEQTLKTFTLVRTQVSAHYVICRDGTVHHMLNDYLRAWHGGNSKWGNMTDLNSGSIGIELDNNGFEPFAEAQITSLLRVLDKLKKSYGIPGANFIGHSDIAPGRKVDPNRFFPWEKLSKNGFGNWYDTIGVKLPENFNALQALRIIGYNTRDTANAIGSFKLHFSNSAGSKLTEGDKKIIYDLMKQASN